MNGGLQGLRIRRMGGQERDKLIQADVTRLAYALNLVLTGRRFGNTYLLPSIDRILSWKGDTQERTMKKSNKNGRLPSCTFWITRFVPVPSVLTWQWLFVASILTTWLHRMQLMGPKLFMHVADQGWYLPSQEACPP